ncbi:DUF3558 domain-containing protein [Actinophytocola sp.]|uniref:DUF3558 domain-containing protein n=1 Tax=Actinophytocola sp. TaxID=1872138 RepID=UPI002D4445C0|nr:DUF3558 domain-containing protein [Actinophytocola sp.]HYQ69513.1 DUF3558 domain-containing protein [Actinophytocola sp.]
MLTAVAACSSATAGQPRPTETSSRSSAQPTEESTSETEAPEYSLARLCELLSPEEAEQLGGSTEGKKGNSTSDGHAICTWANETSLVVGWQTGTSTAQADTGPGITNTPTKIDGLPAVQALSTNTVVICEILVDLPSGKMIAASVSALSAGEGKYDQCQVANQLANLIIPRVKDQ